jgi:hypothetical protein
LTWAAGLALVGTGLLGCYLLQSRTGGVDSDAAAIGLQAWDMQHGNVLLHGWRLADVTFYTTELPEYALVEAVRGLRADDVHICAALTYTLLVLTTALVARGPARGREGIVRAVLAGGIMVAPELGYGTTTLLESPDHTGTGVPIMIILLLIDRAKPRWYLPPLVLALLIWVQMGDALATYAAAGPIAAVCLARTGLRLARTRRGPAHSPEPAWYDLALAAAAAASVPLAHAALAAIRKYGGFYAHPVPGRAFTSVSALPHQARVVGLCVLILFGADPVGQSPGLMAGIAAAHIAGIVLAGLGLLAGIRWFFGRTSRVSQILLAGTLAILAAGWIGARVASGFDAHEIAVVLPFAAALAGRTLGSRVVELRLEPVLALVLAGYLAALGVASTQPTAPPATNQQLADWLVANHLSHGLAGYWQADSVNLDSGGAVTLAPIFGSTPYTWEARESWYDPALSYANFVVSASSPPAEAVFAKPHVMVRSFGPPVQVLHFKQYVIMIWNQNLLTRLSALPGP